jgi:hypothetical protein
MSKQNDEFKRMGIPDPVNTLIKYLGRDGKESDEYSSVAKKIQIFYSVDDVRYQYYVRVGRGELIDPFGVDSTLSRKKISDQYKFKKVGEKAFSHFLKYLQTKNKIHFTTARRLLVSER